MKFVQSEIGALTVDGQGFDWSMSQLATRVATGRVVLVQVVYVVAGRRRGR